MEAMKVSYTHLLSDRDHLLNLAGIYSDALKNEEELTGFLMSWRILRIPWCVLSWLSRILRDMWTSYVLR